MSIVHRSEGQQYSFNFPYQCGFVGDADGYSKSIGQEANTDSHLLQENDIIVMASDGVWDNMFDDDIKKIVAKHLVKNKIERTQDAADEIALTAEQLGDTVGYLSPFAVEASKQFLDYQPRGKPDDVTVIVAQLQNGNSQQIMQGSGLSKPFYERER